MTVHLILLLFAFVAKGDEYHVFREDSNQQWDSVKSYYKKVSSHFTFSWDYFIVIFKPDFY